MKEDLLLPTIVPYDIRCQPSPSVPAETLLQDGWYTYLLFFACTKSIDETGYLKDLGVAVLSCKDCLSAKFGYPNDEGLPEHPLYGHGLADVTEDVVVVKGSPWLAEVTGRAQASADRIWGGRGMLDRVGPDINREHFLVTLKEKTFECLASSLVVDRFEKTFDDAFAYVIERFNEH